MARIPFNRNNYISPIGPVSTPKTTRGDIGEGRYLLYEWASGLFRAHPTPEGDSQ